MSCRNSITNCRVYREGGPREAVPWAWEMSDLYFFKFFWENISNKSAKADVQISSLNYRLVPEAVITDSNKKFSHTPTYVNLIHLVHELYAFALDKTFPDNYR